MTKKTKLSLVGLLASAVMFSSVGCLGKPPADEIPEIPGGGMQTTIGDAYDYNEDGTGSTRPTIPGGYYDPSLPITETMVRISESSKITFADGSREKLFKLGTPFTNADFDQSALDGHEVGGLALLNADGAIVGYNSLAEFAPQAEVTVIPYYANENGNYLWFGSNGYDYGNGIATASITAENALVDGYAGRILHYSESVRSAGNRVRIKSTFNREEGSEYTYYYTFKNYGDTSISFTAYQMNGGENISGTDAEPSYGIVLAPGESKSVIIAQDINKNDGNAMTIIRFDAPALNGFDLGVVQAVKNTIDRVPAKVTLDLPEGFTVSDEYKTEYTTFDLLELPAADQITNDTGKTFLHWSVDCETPITAKARVYGDMTLKPVFPKAAKITVKLPEGMTVSDSYVTDVMTYDKLVLPTADQIQGNANGAPSGWYDFATGGILGADVSIIGDMTIAPYWETLGGYSYVAVGSSQSTGYNSDEVPGNLFGNGGKYEGLRKGGGSAQMIDCGKTGTYLGSVISCAQPVTAGVAVRLDSVHPNRWSGDGVLEFAYTLHNGGTSRLKLSIYQVSASSEYKSGSGFYNYETIRYRTEFDLEPGESATKLAQYVLAGSNANALTYIVFEEDVDSFKFGISIGSKIIDGATGVADEYKNQAPRNNYVNIEYDETAYRGLTVSESYLRQLAGRLIIAPTESEYTLPEGERLAGWKLVINGTEKPLPANRNYGGLLLPSAATVELKPVFVEYKTVTVSLPDGVTLDGYDTSVRVFDGETLILPTDDQVKIADGRHVRYWVAVYEDGERKINDNSYVFEDITIRPVLSAPVGSPVSVTRGELPAGFTVSDSYINTTRAIGDTFALPADGQYNNDTDKKLVGWTVTDTETGDVLVENALTTDMVIEVTGLTVTPVLVERAQITVQLPDGVTLDGYAPDIAIGEELVLPTGAQLVGNKNGDPAGWYNYATGEILPNGTEAPRAITIAPYWQTVGDYEYLAIGTGRNKPNPAYTPGGLFADDGSGTAEYLGMTNVDGSTAMLVNGVNGYTYLGSIVSSDRPVIAGSAMRFDSKYKERSPENGIIEFCFNLINSGETNLKLSIYQINGAADHTASGQYGYESRYRIEVNLAPGESMSKTGQYLLNSNNNAITYIVFEKDAESFEFGFSIGYKVIEGATDVADEYKNQAPLANDTVIKFDTEKYADVTVDAGYLTQRVGRLIVAPAAEQYTVPEGSVIKEWRLLIDGKEHVIPKSISMSGLLLSSDATFELVPVFAEKVTVKVNLPEGITLNGYAPDIMEGAKLYAPTAEMVSGSIADGRTLVGWFDTANGSIIGSGGIIADSPEITIAPYFKTTDTALTPLSGAGAGEKGCPYGPDNVTASLEGKFAKQSDIVGGDEKGIRLTCSADMAVGNAFRFKTTYKLETAKSYTFTYRFTNYGSGKLAFTVYQINSGTETDGRDGKKVELTSGESIVVDLTISNVSNGNALSYFVMDAAASGFNLGVAMSVAVNA